jgi:hypothetical protein
VAGRITALLGVLLAVAGCVVPGSAAPQGFIEGSTLHTMNFGGVDRSYRLYIPAGLASPAPLVVMMHGGFGSAQQAERAYGWDELADSAKFVVAYPDGVGRAWNVNGGCCGRPGRQNIDDVGFVTSVVGDIAAHRAGRARPPLADVADEPFARAETRRLEELHLTALELAIEGDLEAGRHREMIGRLESLVGEHPLRERLHGHGCSPSTEPDGRRRHSRPTARRWWRRLARSRDPSSAACWRGSCTRTRRSSLPPASCQQSSRGALRRWRDAAPSSTGCARPGARRAMATAVWWS